jgi:ClpA/ClpB-like protein
MSDLEWTGPYSDALRRGSTIAHELGRRCGPVHLLVGISAGQGPAAAALIARQGGSLRDVVTAADPGDGAIYLNIQAQDAARSLAHSLNESLRAEHLLIAVLDQGTPAAIQALHLAGLDPVTVRQAALSAIGAPADLPLIPLPELPPAGAMNRPPLPADELDSRAWEILCWRRDRLPLGRLHGRSGRAAGPAAPAHTEKAAPAPHPARHDRLGHLVRQPLGQHQHSLASHPHHAHLPQRAAAMIVAAELLGQHLTLRIATVITSLRTSTIPAAAADTDAPAVTKVTENPCFTEKKGSHRTLLFPSDTNLPPKGSKERKERQTR